MSRLALMIRIYIVQRTILYIYFSLMKYAIGAFMATLSLGLLVPGVRATSEDNQIIDALDKYAAEQQNATTQDLKESFDLKTFSSCEDMSTVLTKYLKETFDENSFGYGR